MKAANANNCAVERTGRKHSNGGNMDQEERADIHYEEGDEEWSDESVEDEDMEKTDYHTVLRVDTR